MSGARTRRNSYLQGTVRVDGYSSDFQLLDKFHLPATGIVQWNVDHTVIVRRNFHIPFRQSADAISTKAFDEISEFENDVLSDTRFQISRVFQKCTHVVWSQEGYGELDLSVVFEFLYDCLSLI